MSKVSEPSKTTHKNYSWVVAYPDGGTRRRKYFKKKEGRGGAEEWYKARRKKLAADGSKHAAVTDAEFDAVKKFRKEIAGLPENVTVGTLSDAVTQYFKTLQIREKSRPLQEVADRLLLEISKRKINGHPISKRHIDDVTSRLNRFTSEYGDRLACDITKEIIEDFLGGNGWGDQTQKNYLNKIKQLFIYAVKIGACDPDSNPTGEIEKIGVAEEEPGVLTPSQLAKLLSTADETALPGIAISFFAGLRRSEVEQLDWSDIDFEDRTVEISARIAKKNKRRLVAMSDNLVEWLLPLKKHEGRVCVSHSRFRTALEKAQEKAGIKDWPHNAGRHSFASYHVAHHRNAALTAAELGHPDSKLLYEHYRKVVGPKEALAYWGIRPVVESEIVKIAAG